MSEADHDRAMAAKAELIGAMREEFRVRNDGRDPDAKQMRAIEDSARKTAERCEGRNREYRYQQQRRR